MKEMSPAVAVYPESRGGNSVDIAEAKKILRAIIKYKPKEFVYDRFAYDRMVGEYRRCAKLALDSLKNPKS